MIVSVSLLEGLAVGGTWGLYEGLRNPDGKTMKLRVNRSCFEQVHFMFISEYKKNLVTESEKSWHLLFKL